MTARRSNNDVTAKIVGATFCLYACLVAALPAGADEKNSLSGNLAASASRIEADVRYLADDLLEGRETGTRGYDLAALYVASQYRHAGLEPGGDKGTYFQNVPLIRGTRQAEGARLAIQRGELVKELKFEHDFLHAINYEQGSCAITAPMVFVGQAVVAPELQHDDFAGVDVKGKIAVYLSNAPARFPNDQRAYYADGVVKLRELERRGAVGTLAIGDPVNERKRSWELGAANWRQSGMRVIGADGRPRDTFPGIRCRASVRAHQADLIFAGAPHTAAEVFAMLDKGELRSFHLVGTASIAGQARLEPVSSRNVIGRLPGVDTKLSAEHVVLTAHLDHLGIGAPYNGDTIYNGAQDNAVGIAVMLEAGRMLKNSLIRPQRSLLLVATTAEEKGLLGAEYFAAHPTVPVDSIVANVNMDMPFVLSEVTDVIPIGIEHSSLEAVAKQAVQAAGLTLTPDPQPDEVVFVRSDQYPLVSVGVPAIYLKAGIKPRDGSDGLAALKEFRAKRYHLPNDDLEHPIDWTGAARLASVNYNITLVIATDQRKPTWNTGDFFGDKFGKGSQANPGAGNATGQAR